ncbi:MAG: Exopolyphosphatase (EC [uncultured Sulfurovum sp.]|uniref:Exopolyphosphatase (EC) n=1 Tax=uncultured Sulfurovum sp. TaxID=269237 RepID=A0A6S6T4E7_9BACT|nr:MAG: Exopolyphosphatase (EC [uncultured Sulfurovum sp.]
MDNCTAVIDIGSNSARLVIYEKSSKYGFHLICERKSKVRIGEGAYEKNGYLQPTGIQRAYLALKEFIATTHYYPVDKILCVATSALRDAPNGQAFVAWIKKELKLEIEIIDGRKEALFGAIAAQNLLPLTNGITIDIGGGSSDLSLLENSKVIKTYSLNIGTVRLKELFFDKNKPIEEARRFVRKELQKLPKEFRNTQVIGIGGTARTLSKSIMKMESYPFNTLHAFSYKVDEHMEYFQNISEAKPSLLKYLHISKGRFDTIREGTLIWEETLRHVGAKKVVTSGVGVREGVFLHDFLKNDNLQFPKNINPSIESILDRFETHHVDIPKRKENSEKLFNLFLAHKKIENNYLKELLYATELSTSGYRFNLYKSYEHTFYVAMQEFNYAVTHETLVLTAMILRFGGKSLHEKEIYKKYKKLLPKKETLEFLSFIYSITTTLYDQTALKDFDFSLEKNKLTIIAKGSLYLVEESLNDIERPQGMKLKIIDEQKIPSYNF